MQGGWSQAGNALDRNVKQFQTLRNLYIALGAQNYDGQQQSGHRNGGGYGGQGGGDNTYNSGGFNNNNQVRGKSNYRRGGRS